MDSRITVTTEQAPTDPLIPMLVTRVRVDEMAVATPPLRLVALPNAHRVHAEAFQRRAARARPVRAGQCRSEGSSRQPIGLRPWSTRTRITTTAMTNRM